MLRIGELVDGRYVVESLLGQGGLAEVYQVRHRELNSVHALKMLTWRRQSLAERMLLEGRIQAQIRHPYVVAVTDVIRHDGRCGLLMELVAGQNLEHYLQNRGALPLDEGLQLFAAILAAVTAAHDAGVLHRDLKPANVLLAPSSGGVIPKVADFGIAKVVAEDLDQGFTAVGSLMGSPGYLAPEQTRDSGSVDKRADIYALAVILYEILSGGRAFPDANDALSARRAALTAPPSLHTVRSDLPDSLVRAIQKAMSPDIDTRHPDCRALARDVFAEHPQLLQLVERQQLSDAFSLKLTPTPTPAPEDALATIDQGSLGAPTTPLPLTNITVAPPTTDAPRRSPPLLIAAIVAILLTTVGATVGAAALYTLSRTAGDNPTPPPEPLTAAEPEMEPEPEPGPVVEPEPEPLVEPIEEPEPTPEPEPEPIPEPEPEPVVESEPVAEAEPVAEPEPIVESEPAVEPEPVAELEDGVVLAEPEPEPEVVRVDPVLGVWTGTANGQRFQLEIVDAGDGAVRSTITFFQGSNQRTATASGRYESSTGALELRSDEGLVFRGVLRGSELAGSYQRGGRGRSFAWSVSRG